MTTDHGRRHPLFVLSFSTSGAMLSLKLSNLKENPHNSWSTGYPGIVVQQGLVFQEFRNSIRGGANKSVHVVGAVGASLQEGG